MAAREPLSAQVGALDSAFLEALPGGVVHVLADGSVAAANAEALRILGMSYDALTQRYTRDFESETIWEDGSPCAVEDYPVSKALATGEVPPAVTIGVRRPDGALSWALYRAVPIKAPDSGRVLGAIVTFLDVTERKRTEQALRDSRELLRTAQSMAKVGSWEWDIASGKMHFSEETYRILRVDPERFEPSVSAVVAMVHDEDRPLIERRMTQVLDRGEVIATEFRVERPDRSVVTLLAWGEATRDARGKPMRAVGALQDVTERRQLEAQLRQSQRLESVGQLAGGVAHDFNNLIQVILANVALGRRGADAGAALDSIRLAAEQAAELTRQLLTFSRRHPFRPLPVDVNVLVADMMRLLPQVLGERVRVELDLAPDLPRAHGDRALLDQVLMNLCINARDAMPEGGTIRVRTRALDRTLTARGDSTGGTGPFVEIEVRDSGVGMSDEVRAHIFEPFFTTKSVGKGTGLGLSVVHGIVEQHGGSIEVESEVSRGTTFRVRLPGTTESAASGASDTTKPVGGAGEHLLVVEDDEMVRSAIASLLRAAGYRVSEATDGLHALQVCASDLDSVDLVLTDVMMPGMTGPELAERLRERRPDLPILFTSGYAANGNVDAGETLLGKPYSLEVLLRAIAGALHR